MLSISSGGVNVEVCRFKSIKKGRAITGSAREYRIINKEAISYILYLNEIRSFVRLIVMCLKVPTIHQLKRNIQNYIRRICRFVD